jgi:hypothetical protein
MPEAKLGYRFAAIPEWVLFCKTLQDVDIRVFGVLARVAVRRQGRPDPTLHDIGVRIGKSEDTIRRSIKRLEAVGAIATEEVYDKSGRQLPNVYLLSGDAPVHSRGGAGATHPGGTDASPRGGTDATDGGSRERDPNTERGERERVTSPDGDVGAGGAAPRNGATRPRTEKQQRMDRAQTILNPWWEERKSADLPVAQSWAACRAVIAICLANGVSEEDVAWALRHAPAVSGGAIEMALNLRSKSGPKRDENITTSQDPGDVDL